MADILNLQGNDTPEAPDETKGSNRSYFVCHNSYTSNYVCWRP